jgi:8-oxo-dGTP diphosphatase
MKIFYAVSAFLKNGDNYLLMKRAENRRYYPGVWSCIGGRVEEGEASEPERACLREIAEETGIPADKIADFKLRYIHAAPRNAYITIHYIFFGETDVTDLIETDEGETYWIPKNEAPGKGFTQPMRLIIEHYLSQAAYNGVVYLYNENNGMIMPLADN